MMKRLSFGMGLFLVLWITPPARTQEARTGPTVAEANPPSRTEARVLYQAWRALQRQNSRNIQRVSVKERLESRFDGPTGSWNTSVDLRLQGYPDRPEWQIDLTSFTSDNRTVPPSETEALLAEWEGLLGEPFASMIQDPAFPMAQLESMKPAGSAQEEVVGDAILYRIDMVPAAGGALYQRITLWVDKSGRLTRTRSTSINRRSELTTVTEYRREGGIDVPAIRTFEGHVQSRRRSRLSTLFFSIQATYESIFSDEPPAG